MAAIDLLAKRARLVCAGLAGDVPSPCVSVCKVDSATELCEGCYRTLDEIAAWGRMDDGSKREVWGLIKRRIDERALTPALSRREREQDTPPDKEREQDTPADGEREQDTPPDKEREQDTSSDGEREQGKEKEIDT